jgi:CubicO group peptidase (beta-lactamase class C family)
MILGILTSKLAGKHWSAFQSERIVKPLGMTIARIVSESNIVPIRAAGYELDDKGEVKNQEWVSPTVNTTSYADYRVVPGMGKGLAEIAAGSVREACGRSSTGKHLATIESFTLVGEDDYSARPVEMVGDRVVRDVYCTLTSKNSRSR